MNFGYRFEYPIGLSAQAIAGHGRNHPHDPSDLLRCINYCTAAGVSTETLQHRMAGKSVQWDRLLPEWDNLVALLRHEQDTRTDGLATATYIEMRRVLDNGIPCATCQGTGRGQECPKCKGTGRRSGGRCRGREPYCHRGADFCPGCRGAGFTVAKVA